MAKSVEMPKLSDTMEEGVLSSWQAEEGDNVEMGDILAQVETDKATMDLEAFEEGVLLKKVIDEGDSVPIGALIAVIGEKGEDISDLLEEPGGEIKKASPEDIDPGEQTAGYVYILINRDYNKNLLVIGKTRQAPEKKASDLSRSTDVSGDFVVAYEVFLPNPDVAKQNIRKELAAHRANGDRDFFRLPLKKAIAALNRIAVNQVFLF